VCLTPKALVADLPRLEAWIDARRKDANGLVLIGRRHLRSNISWMHNARSLVKGPDRAQLRMHPADATRLGLANGSRVRVTSRTGAIVAPLEVTDEVMPGVVCFPHGFGHKIVQGTLRVAGALDAASANELTDEMLVEPVIGTSILNGVPVAVERAP
jgi:anaerobic selenocysteine-containing dehydrogenase